MHTIKRIEMMLALMLTAPALIPQTPTTINTYPATVGTPTPAAPTLVNLGRDMTPSTKYLKPKVVPQVVKVKISSPAPAKPVGVRPVKLQPPPYDGQR